MRPSPNPSLTLSSLLFLCVLRPSSLVHSPSPHTCPLLPPCSLLLSSISCVQIDQPEFDVPLKQEKEQKIYAQVRWLCGQRSGPDL